MTQDTDDKIQQLQQIEQSLNSLLGQKQNFQTQLIEINSALKEMGSSQKIYKIVGNIMVLGEKKKIEEDLVSKKDIVELRIKNIEKQEDQIKQKAKKIQSDVLKDMKAGEKDDR
jgi:prefoldin beta subunit